MINNYHGSAAYHVSEFKKSMHMAIHLMGVRDMNRVMKPFREGF